MTKAYATVACSGKDEFALGNSLGAGQVVTMPKDYQSEPGITAMQEGAGKRLAWVRDIANLSQTRMAEALGVDQSAWSRWEAGKGMPDVYKMAEFARRFKCSLDYVYRGRLDAVHRDLALKLAALHPELVLDPTDTDQDTDKPPPSGTAPKA